MDVQRAIHMVVVDAIKVVDRRQQAQFDHCREIIRKRWAFTVAPIPLVAALRETGIIFALLLGVFVLKERLDLVKVLATLGTLLGIGLLRINS